MTDRCAVMRDAQGVQVLIEQYCSELVGEVETLVDLLIDAEDVIAEQDKRIDILESKLDDANALIADLKEDIKEYRSGAQLREGWEL